MDVNTLLPYIYGSVSIIIIILLYIAYAVFRIKRRIWKELNEDEPTPQMYAQQQIPQYQQPQYN